MKRSVFGGAARSTFASFVLLSLGSAAGQDLFVASSVTDSVLRYDGTTGAFIGVFVTSGSGGLDEPRDLTFGPDGNLYVVSLVTNSVLRYDGDTGAFMGVFASAGLGSPWALDFGADDDLYVTTTQDGGCVRHFDGVTGGFLSTYVCPGAFPQGLKWSGSGNAFVSNAGAVREFDAGGSLVTTYTGGMSLPRIGTVGPDGDYYVCDVVADSVMRCDTSTGTVSTFVTPGSGGLDAPNGAAFGPDGNLYVASAVTDSVLRYDGTTGAFLGAFVTAGSGGLDAPVGLAFDDNIIQQPGLAEYGDAPDNQPSCQFGTIVDPSMYPTEWASTNGIAPVHEPLADPNDDIWYGDGPTYEIDAIEAECDWLSSPCDFEDDGVFVLCLDAGCTTGVIWIAGPNCDEGGIAPFGLTPTAGGFFLYAVSRGPFSSQAAFDNVAVDWTLDADWGDPGEWIVVDRPLAVLPWQTQVFVTPVFPVPTVYPCGNPLGWCIGPGPWARFHLSPSPLLPLYPGLDWNGSAVQLVLEGMETEDTLPFTDPQVPGCPELPRTPPFESTGQLVLTLDPGDPGCVNGANVALDSIGLEPAVARRFMCGGYVTGQSVMIELLQLELRGFDPIVGPVTVRERNDAMSLGLLSNVIADQNGNLVQADSFFDITIEIELPARGRLLHSGDQAVRIEGGTISELPAIGQTYFMAPNQRIQLFDAHTNEPAGWLCHLEHTATRVIEPTSETVCPENAGDFRRLFGGPVTGNALLLCESDDRRLEVLQAAQLSPLLPFIRFECWARTSLAEGLISRLEYEVECHVSANVPGGQNPNTLRTLIRNYAQNRYELVDLRGTNAFNDELIAHVQADQAADYVQPGDGEIRIRQDVFNPGNVFNLNWRLKVDRYEVTVFQ